MTSAALGAHPRLLLIATTILLPYRILRCAEAAGAKVWVLGAPGGAGLRYSNRIEGYSPTGRIIDGCFDPGLAEEINLTARRLGVDMVLAGDAPSTRSLIAVRELVNPECFPMPDLERFDLLNDKWRFHGLCGELGIERPKSALYADAEALRRDVQAGRLEFASIAKPLSMDNSIGCIVLGAQTAERDLLRIFYAPIVVQDYIAGADIGASVYCSDGEILAFIAHKYHHQTYETFYDDHIYSDIEKVSRTLHLNGVFNFDMRLTPEGCVYFLECNPRFFFKIAMSMLSGINFVALGLPGARAEATPVRCGKTLVQLPKALLAALPTPWKLRARSWNALKFALGDPVPFLREELGFVREGQVRPGVVGGPVQPTAAAPSGWGQDARQVA
jgi:hypothetical protein